MVFPFTVLFPWVNWAMIILPVYRKSPCCLSNFLFPFPVKSEGNFSDVLHLFVGGGARREKHGRQFVTPSTASYHDSLPSLLLFIL